jgi:hypothetical protein
MESRFKLSEHSHYAWTHGDDTLETAGWRLGQRRPAGTRGTLTERDNE